MDPSNTNLDASTIVTFTFSTGANGADQHGIAWAPVSTGGPALPLNYILSYSVDLTPAAIAAGVKFTQVANGINTGGQCFASPTSQCSNATKDIYTDLSANVLLDSIQAAQNVGGATTAVAGKTSLYIYDTVNWNSSELYGVSSIYTDKQSNSNNVSEPDSIPLLGIGLVSMAFGRRALKKKLHG